MSDTTPETAAAGATDDANDATEANGANGANGATEPIVEVKHLTKRFGNEVAVDDLTLSIEPGTIFGFIGPSGSGKTTTVRLLTGVQTPTSGEIKVFGIAPSAFTERERAKIGYMPQLSVLFPHLSIIENLRFVASIYGMPWGRRGRLNQALEFVELHKDRRKRLRHASGGMQRRLALAAALVNDPVLLFLDEPTAGIDPVLRRKFWDHFRSLRDEGRTLFVTTQYVGEAAYCDQIGVLREGRLLTVDTPDGLRRQAFGGEVIDLIVADRIDQDLITEVTQLEYVVHAQRTRVDGRGLRVTVEDADPVIPRLQQWLVDRGIRIESVDRYLPPFDDVFVNIVQASGSTELAGVSEVAVEPEQVDREKEAGTAMSPDTEAQAPAEPPDGDSAPDGGAAPAADSAPDGDTATPADDSAPAEADEARRRRPQSPQDPPADPAPLDRSRRDGDGAAGSDQEDGQR